MRRACIDHWHYDGRNLDEFGVCLLVKPPKERSQQELLIANLKKHFGISSKSIDLFKELIVASDYFSRDDHQGGAVMPGTKHYRKDGSQHVLSDVPMEKLLKDVEKLIAREVPEAKRADVFREVMPDVPMAASASVQDEVVYEPHAEPQTDFSMSKADSKSVKSNEQLVSDLASAAKLDERTAKAIKTQITWWDGLGDDKKPCFMSFSDGIRGGRLGRDHTLEDVPNHYVRDCVVDYIHEHLAKKTHSRVLEAVFDDLTGAEVKQYSAAIVDLKKEQQIDAGVPPVVLSQERRIQARKALKGRTLKNLNEVKNVYEQEAKLEAIEDHVSRATRARRAEFSVRQHSTSCSVYNSVIRPGISITAQELKIALEMDKARTYIDKDCDQIRAMIKNFTSSGIWTAEQFREATGLDRGEFIDFLDRRGPTAGIQTRSYEQAWEFFKRREKLGLSSEPGSDSVEAEDNILRNALREVDGNARKKRPSNGAPSDGRKKKPKRKI